MKRPPAARRARPFATGGVVALLAVGLILPSLAAPGPAFAFRAGSDTVGAVTLSSGKVAASSAPDIDAAAGIVVSGDGNVVWSRHPDVRRAMASTTKLMTALIAIEQGRLGDPTTVTGAASNTDYGIGLAAGQRITRRQLLELALVASSNDAAYALGESYGAGMPAFVAKMNARARALGMRDTHYVNPHGLDAPGHYSSPRDLTTLLRKLVGQPEFRRITALRSVSAPGVGVLNSTDGLLRAYPGLIGGKTGTTSGAGYCFVSAAKRNGITLLAAVLGSSSGGARFTDSAQLLDWGFAHASKRQVAARGQGAGSVKVAEGSGREVALRVGSDASVVVLDVADAVSRHLSVPARVGLPVFAGQRLGTMELRQAGQTIASVPVVAAESVGSVDETVGAVPVADYLDRTVVARSGTAGPVPSFDASRRVDRRVVLQPDVTAPVSKGQPLGHIEYTQAGRTVLTVPVVADSAMPAPGAFDSFVIALVRGLRAVVGGPTMAPLLVHQ